MSDNNKNNSDRNIDSELDSMFDITPKKVKGQLDAMYKNSVDKGLVMECEILSDELSSSSPRDAWEAIKRPFTREDKAAEKKDSK